MSDRWSEWDEIEAAQAEADRPRDEVPVLPAPTPRETALERPRTPAVPKRASPRLPNEWVPPERPPVDDVRGLRLLARLLQEQLDRGRG
jgi:hypothetical protein